MINIIIISIDRFPMKMLLHLLLVIFSSAQVLLMVSSTGDYSRNQEHVWYYLFLNSAADYNGVDFPKKFQVSDISTLVQLVNTSVSNYYALANDNMIEDYYPEYLSK